MQRRTNTRKDDGVSPVVGVMLMLVVTIIIAAVVSIFAGGLMTSTEKAPSITMSVDIKNGGDYKMSHFQAQVLTISQPINTSDLKLITTWSNGTAMQVTTALPNAKATNMSSYSKTNLSAPWGSGTGVKSNSMSPTTDTQQFGNYTLVGGTVMYAYPSGQGAGNYVTVGSTGYGVTTAYEYTGMPEGDVDGMIAVLGKYWYELRTGDRINVQLIHTPSGKTIYDSDVVVS